ncbi:MAG: CBS domain-containing protein [Pseudonocardia sp.]
MSSTSDIARLPRAGRSSSGPERSLRARDVMRSPAPAVSPDTPLAAVATLLAATGCSAVAVVDPGGAVVGLVTETDVVHYQLCVAPRGGGQGITAGETMTRHPLLAPARYDLTRLAGLMLAAGVAVVPIVDAGRLVGAVDLRDLARLAAASNTPTIGRQVFG